MFEIFAGIALAIALTLSTAAPSGPPTNTNLSDPPNNTCPSDPPNNTSPSDPPNNTCS
jgi:hypothetical protein